MNGPVPARLRVTLDAAGLLADAALATARATAKFARDRRRARRGSTVRPGEATPLWNELTVVVRPLLRRRGEQVKLSRLLGVPRQRIHDYFIVHRAYPDAERLLLLLQWLRARQAGQAPG